MSDCIRVLIVEDGTEYIERARRWMGEGFSFQRAGCGGEACRLLDEDSYDVVWLDMDFRRTNPDLLLGEPESPRRGDSSAEEAHLAEHQGLYILSALRSAGHTLPVIFSHDFSEMPKRWSRLVQRLGPSLDWLPETADPEMVQTRFRVWSAR